MIRRLLVLGTILAASGALAADQPSVQLEPTNLQGPRPLAKQTESAVVRDYLQAWQGMAAAMDQNRPDLLNQDFVGEAREKLAATIAEQTKLGRTRPLPGPHPRHKNNFLLTRGAIHSAGRQHRIR